MFKLAGHVEDRLKERSRLDEKVLHSARGRLGDLPDDGQDTYHWTIRSGDKVHGHLAVRRVGKDRKPVLTTFLAPHMKPSGRELSDHTGPLEARELEKAAGAGMNKVRTFAGLVVRVDRPKGFVQHGKDSEGNPWTRVYKVPYGYIPRTEGGDGEDLDVFLGPREDSKKAYLIHQKKEDGTLDEFKLMLGFEGEEEAKACYLEHVPAKFFQRIEPVSLNLVRALTGRPLDNDAEKAAAAAGLLMGELFAEKLAASLEEDEAEVARRVHEHAQRPHRLKYEGLQFAEEPFQRTYESGETSAVQAAKRKLVADFKARMAAAGVEPRQLDRYEANAYATALDMGDARMKAGPRLTQGLGDMADMLQPGLRKKMYGRPEEAPGNRALELHHGTKLRDMVQQLEGLEPDDRTGRNKLLQQIMQEDADVYAARMKNNLHAAGKAILPAIKDGVRKTPGKALGYTARALGLGALQFGGARYLQREGFRRNFLSPEERQLPEEEQSKLLIERSPTYKNLFAKSEETPDLTAQDFLSPAVNLPSLSLLKSESKILDNLSGGHVGSFLDPHEALARVVGAQQFWHGTTPESGEQILGTKEAPGSGIDPGHGGRKGGFTWKATHQQDLAQTGRRIHELSPFGTGSVDELEDYAPALGVRQRGYTAHQPKQFLPGMASLGGDGNLDLDTSHFLDNARGNYFVATDRRAAEGYARAMSPEIYTKPIQDLEAAGKDLQGLMGEGRLGANRETKDAISKFISGGMKMTGLADPAPEKKYLVGGVMPYEKFHALHEADGDDVKQRGKAFRLREENRVTPYAPGETPDPSRHGRAIGVENLADRQVSLKQILKNRSENLGDYIRGVNLPDSERVLGLNKRFLSGLGRGAAIGGTYGAAYHASGLHPLVKKLYNKAKGRLSADAPVPDTDQPSE